MATYSFTLVLGAIAEIPADVPDAEFNDRMNAAMDEICGALLVAGCDDSSVSSRGQTVSLGFDREADSLGKAIGSAIEDVEKAGYKVARVEVEEVAAVG